MMKQQLYSPTWLLEFFSTLEKSNRLEEVALDLDHHRESDVDWAFWGDIGRILSGSHFRLLRKIEIDLWPHEEICKNLAEIFQPVREIGILVEIEGESMFGPL
jgi:hypothetical protein